MVIRYKDYAEQVDAWLAKTSTTLTASGLVEVGDAAFRAIWQRAKFTISEITLTAILERVLIGSAEQYPFLASLRVSPKGINPDGLRRKAAKLPRESVLDGLRFVLIEFISILGNLTDDVITPALLEELRSVTPRGPQSQPVRRNRTKQ